MARRNPFVAEVAVDFEYAFEPAYHQALQIQLGCDTQKHLHIECIVVGSERFGRGAAWNRVQHRRFHFEELRVRHEIAHR